MKDLKFIRSWEKTRRRGKMLYILVSTVLLLACSVIGKIIGDYVALGVIARPFHWPDMIALAFLFFFFILMTARVWNKNEERYKELVTNENQDMNHLQQMEQDIA